MADRCAAYKSALMFTHAESNVFSMLTEHALSMLSGCLRSSVCYYKGIHAPFADATTHVSSNR